MVDFDLEAPGLETFPALGFSGPHKGIVDYIHKYMTEGKAPSVGDYVHECAAPAASRGRLWLMTAGHAAERYGDKFTKIDWQSLYSEHNGYLMFEDLKLQWKGELSPDYVLIDSRTGHTDVGGICTRQLPDSVFLFFFPNIQNLRGLTKVAQDIRDEKATGRDIGLGFVLSNVPKLDDEAGILKRLLETAKDMLNYSELAATIHHYDSLSLLEQDTFVISRPRTSLADEYRALSNAVIKDNIDDRDGVLEYLRVVQEQALGHFVSNRNGNEVFDSTRLAEIQDCYEADDEVLFLLASLYEFKHDEVEAISILRQAAASPTAKADVFFQLARLTRTLEGATASIAVIERLFEAPDAYVRLFRQVVPWVRDVSSPSLQRMLDSAVFNEAPLKERVNIGELMLWAGCEPYLHRLYEQIKPANGQVPSDVFHHITLIALGLGDYATADALLSCPPQSGSLLFTFNGAMARWGLTKSVPRDIFETVLSLHDVQHNRSDANYWQCIAIAFSAVGNMKASLEALAAARERHRTRYKIEFSAWRYRYVGSADFAQDIEQMEAEILSGELHPPSISYNVMNSSSR